MSRDDVIGIAVWEICDTERKSRKAITNFLALYIILLSISEEELRWR